MIQIGQLQVSLESREIYANDVAVQIGSRAFDILELLIQAEGALVSKDTIMRRAWPETVVHENNLQVQIAQLRRLLGEDRDLIRTVPGRGYLLVAGKRRSDRRALPSARQSTATGGLPHVPLALIGREEAVTCVVAALQNARIVTLTGSGGIGKTRVAVEVSNRLRGDFPGGVFFVSLASVSDPRFALDMLAATAGVAIAGARMSLDEITAALAARHTLVVLDNCEHLIDFAASVANALTGANPDLHVLATSREALRVPGEHVQPVTPLDVPPEGAPVENILHSGAVQLFVSCARAADPRFPVDDDSVTLIGVVCRRLDGIPLAIELAAARAAALGLQVLASYLDDHFRILTGGYRTALPRHQTLKAMLDWSYRLLDDTGRMLLRWLGVFTNGFSFDAAFEVVKDQSFSQSEILYSLCALVEKSLIVRDGDGLSGRFRLLELTRAYALQQLEDSGERKAAALAHARHLRSMFASGSPESFGPLYAERCVEFRQELGNLRAILDWAFSPDGDVTVGVELAAVAVPMLFEVSLVDDCRELAHKALQALRNMDAAFVDPAMHIRIAAAHASSLMFSRGPGAAVFDEWREVLALANALGDRDQHLRALWGLWGAAHYAGQASVALELARQFNETLLPADHPNFRAIGKRMEGVARFYVGDAAGAQALLSQTQREYRRPARRWDVVGFRLDHGIAARAMLARVLLMQGPHRDALCLAQEVLDAATLYGHDVLTCYVLAEGLLPVALAGRAFDVAASGAALLRKKALQAGMAAWLACAACFEAYLNALQTPDCARLKAFRHALDALRHTGHLSLWSMLLALYASQLFRVGKADEAAHAIAEAIRHCESSGERWYREEIDRIRETVSAAAGPDASVAPGGAACITRHAPDG